MLELKFFASLRDQLGSSEESINIESHTCVSDVKQALSERGEQWQTAMAGSNVLVAVNQEMAFDSTAIKDGDEIAFFPPVTGG